MQDETTNNAGRTNEDHETNGNARAAREVTVLVCSDDDGDRLYAFTTPEAAYTTWVRIPRVRDFFAEYDPDLLARIEKGEAVGEREDALGTFNGESQDWYIIETLVPEEHPYEEGSLV